MTRLTPSRSPLMETAQASGFVIGGEPLAVDLADTVITVTDPATDLLPDQAAGQLFWALEGPRLPAGWATPSLAETRELRDAVRALLDATLAHCRFDPGDLQIVNRVSGAVTTSLEVVDVSGSLREIEHWWAERPGRLALGAAARSAISLLSNGAELARLRRCANPACSMLFVNGDARRQWCTPNICGNRSRVARHYRRHRQAAGEPG